MRQKVKGRISNSSMVMLGIIVSFLSVLLMSSGGVWARKCVCGNGNPVQESENDSIFDACQNLSSGLAQGVMWVSSHNEATNINSEVIVNDWSRDDGKVDAYLHGAVISVGGNVSGNADYVKLVKGTRKIESICEGCTNYAPFEGVPDSMSRMGNKSCDTQNDFRSSVRAIKLNIPNLIRLETPIIEGSNSHTYKVTIQAFRCFSGVKPPDDRCYSSASTLRVTVALIKLKGIARDVDGKKLPTQPEQPAPVSPGVSNHFEITAPSNTNYRFLGWSSEQTGKNLNYGTNQKYTVDNLSESRTVYAVYEYVPPTITVALSSYAYDYNTGNLITGPCATTWIEIERGKSGSATVNGCRNKVQSVSTDYKFKCWKSAKNGSCLGSTNEDSVTRTISENTQIYAYYEKAVYKGKSEVTGSASASTGYNRDSREADTAFINNCSVISGCKVTFKHSLLHIVGANDRPTNYTITRTSNMTSDKTFAQVTNATLVNNKTWYNSGTEGVEVLSDEITMYPGMVICEKLSFKSDVLNNTSSYTTVCASALGDAQPNLEGEQAFIDIKLRNTTYDRNGYQKMVYAKPADQIIYQVNYNPLLQYTYFIKPQYMQINSGGTPIKGEGKTLGTLFNESVVQLKKWNNGFTVHDSELIYDLKKYPVGEYGDQYESASFPRSINNDDVGKEKTITAQTNYHPDGVVTNDTNPSTNTTPGQVSFEKHCSVASDPKTCFNKAVVKTGVKDSTAKVVIPYNFNNSIELSAQENEVLYAGEKSSVSYTVNVLEKENSLTSNKAYATKVVGAKIKIKICYDGTPCIETEEKNINGDGVLAAKASYNGKMDFVVPDLPAGTKVQIMASMTPSNSGSNDNIDVKKFGGWIESETKTYVIAKRPSIQVVGGNVYTNGDINTGMSVKRRLSNYPDATDKPYVFGSWGELGVIAMGKVSGFASGANLGYLLNENVEGRWKNWPDFNRNVVTETRGEQPGGSRNDDICKLSPLTISNACNGTSVGTVGGQSSVGGINDDKNMIKEYIDDLKSKSDAPDVEGDITFNDESPNYYHSSNGVSIEGSIHKNAIKVIHTENSNVTIRGNVIYADDDYASLEEVPKVIIFAENGNIDINCGVTRIDALLMADNVKTCDSNDINARENSNQLIINGAIIANTLTPNRTYGAATGVNSMVSAEIINYDPTLYLWGGSNLNGESDNMGEVDVTYTRELAPRY